MARVGTVAAVALATVVLGGWVVRSSHAQMDQADAAMAVGVYQPQAVFNEHPVREEMIGELERVQLQMQQAQQAGDTQRIMELQSQMEQKQQEVVERFQQDLNRVMPRVAEEAGVKVVAVQVAYVADDVQTKDVTQQVIASVREAAGATE